MTKPWDNETTPFKDRLVDDYGDFFISQKTVENLERRLRHAERLLERVIAGCYLPHPVDYDVADYLHEAKKEDAQ